MNTESLDELRERLIISSEYYNSDIVPNTQRVETNMRKYLDTNSIEYEWYKPGQYKIGLLIYCPSSGKFRNIGKNTWYRTKNVEQFVNTYCR